VRPFCPSTMMAISIIHLDSIPSYPIGKKNERGEIKSWFMMAGFLQFGLDYYDRI
jgi:hypothetical protein